MDIEEKDSPDTPGEVVRARVGPASLETTSSRGTVKKGMLPGGKSRVVGEGRRLRFGEGVRGLHGGEKCVVVVLVGRRTKRNRAARSSRSA